MKKKPETVINELLKNLSSIIIKCEYVHHRRNEMHGYDSIKTDRTCPAVKRINDSINSAYEFISGGAR